MDIRFIGQPFDDQIGSVLQEALQNSETDRLWMAAAWGKASGLTRVGDALKELRLRGAATEAIVGIDENGATVEGLRLIMELFEHSWIYHDTGIRTFHPKLYVAESSSGATVIVGSGNMTKGGLFTNYEASIVVRIDKEGDPEGTAFLSDVRAYFDRLRGTADACRRLTEEFLQELLSDPTINITSEAKQNRQRAAARSDRPSGIRSTTFGSPVRGLRGAPTPALPPVEADEEDSDLPPPGPSLPIEKEPVDDVAAQEEHPSTPAGVMGFWKQLSANDVSLQGSPGQIIIPRVFLDFFPPLILEMDETTTGGPRQSAVHFPLTFRDGDFTKRVEDARAILYEPAAHAPRKNIELRFTFRDRPVLERLSEGDVLFFIKEDDGAITVERRTSRPTGDVRWRWL